MHKRTLVPGAMYTGRIREAEVGSDAGAFEGMARQVGRWVKPTRVSGTDVDVIVDLLVPESLVRGGRRRTVRSIDREDLQGRRA